MIYCINSTISISSDPSGLDAIGRQTEAHDAAGVTTFLYDSFGSITNETVIGVAGTNTIIRHWDNFGRSLGYSLVGRAAPCPPQRQSTLAYDPATGRLASMLAAGSETPFAWNYLDGSDLKSSLAYPNGLTAFWTYDANNQLLQVCNAFPTNVISQYDYTYDAAGRRVACGKSGSAFAQNDTLSYGYNEKSELTNAVAAVDSAYRYSYEFDDIGNRESSSERGTNSVYTANNLNQYNAVDDFTPQFDDDGNQTLIQTSTGIWSVNYNGENRPVLWTCIQSDNQTITNNQTISMSFDRIGRRVTKNDQRFVYDGYLQIANFEHQTSNIKLQTFIWDPTEPIATRPLVWDQREGSATLNFESSTLKFYTHDGNKNVSDSVAENCDIVAHYEYAPFGMVAAQYGESAAQTPWHFSSEYGDTTLGLECYNFRHYNAADGRWVSRDWLASSGCQNQYMVVCNRPHVLADYLGLAPIPRPGFSGWAPSPFDHIGWWEYPDGLSQELWFDNNYRHLLDEAQQQFQREILDGVDCRFRDNGFLEITSGRINYYPHQVGGLGYYLESPLRVFTALKEYPLVNVSGIRGYDYMSDHRQDGYERVFSLGEFSVDYITPVAVSYGPCVNGISTYEWTTVMYVEDVLGVTESKLGIFDFIARARRVKRAQWMITGHGMCDCCSGAKIPSLFDPFKRYPIEFGYGKY